MTNTNESCDKQTPTAPTGTPQVSLPLRDRLLQLVDSWAGKLVVVAGHHMLIYRSTSNSLVPLMKDIAQQPMASREEADNLYRVGDFPEASFRLGLELICRRGSANTSVAMLVNDHQFRLFQANAPRDEEKIQKLRWTYFRENTALPTGLASVASEFPGVGVNLEKNYRKRPRGSALPSETIFFSETNHRQRFRSRIDHLASLGGWRQRGSDYGFCSELSNEMIWLCDEQGGCGCGGEVVDFLLDLSERETENVIMVVPYECRQPVTVAAEIALRASRQLHNIVIVMDREPDNDWRTRRIREDVEFVFAAHMSREDLT